MDELRRSVNTVTNIEDRGKCIKSRKEMKKSKQRANNVIRRIENIGMDIVEEINDIEDARQRSNDLLRIIENIGKEIKGDRGYG